jgi:hypothetical protein
MCLRKHKLNKISPFPGDRVAFHRGKFAKVCIVIHFSYRLEFLSDLYRCTGMGFGWFGYNFT